MNIDSMYSWGGTAQSSFYFSALDLLAAGVGLIKVAQDSTQTSFFLIIFFVLSILINIFGLNSVAVGKVYYRESVFIKTIIERELGLLKAIPLVCRIRARIYLSPLRMVSETF
jgi:hypothetical protein